MCEFMNQCSGHGICSQNNGLCKCDQGYKGADCAEKAEMLSSSYNRKFELKGTQWVYYYFPNGLSYPTDNFEFTLSSTQPMDIFVSSGSDSDPSELGGYDLGFKQ